MTRHLSRGAGAGAGGAEEREEAPSQDIWPGLVTPRTGPQRDSQRAHAPPLLPPAHSHHRLSTTHTPRDSEPGEGGRVWGLVPGLTWCPTEARPRPDRTASSRDWSWEEEAQGYLPLSPQTQWPTIQASTTTTSITGSPAQTGAPQGTGLVVGQHPQTQQAHTEVQVDPLAQTLGYEGSGFPPSALLQPHPVRHIQTNARAGLPLGSLVVAIETQRDTETGTHGEPRWLTMMSPPVSLS
ncbi:hypothetical protein J4Q44_G00367700 [Coregonus suidteri]|uniref:Uncharacterized protein n=1 Tax=Coregonus suidteri TaxID=861788 RepID=A0AAN8Q6H6_9TELE